VRWFAGRGERSLALNPAHLPLLCDPRTRESLALAREPGSGELVLLSRSGRSFPIRDGIPVFLDRAELAGPNLRNQQLYDRLAPIYDLASAFYVVFSHMSPRARRMEYLREIEVAAGARVLEVSVGTGANLRHLPASAHYFGLDLSWQMLRRCRRRARHGLPVALFQGLAERLPFRDDTFDVVFHVGGINFFSDRSRALAEMVRVARPGSRIMVVDATEKLASRHERTPIAAAIYGGRPEAFAPPTHLLPAGVHGVQLKEVAAGDLYCLTFRKT